MKSAAPQGVPAHDDHTDASFRRALPKTVNAAGIAISSSALGAGKGGNAARRRRLKIVDEFTDLPVSRSRKNQLRRKKAGLCTLCGKPRNLYWEKCDACQARIREGARRLKGFQPWQPGRRGRPPACHSIKNPIQKAA